jgi:uncharacterized membrane protein YsdA (DUF1294 family)
VNAAVDLVVDLAGSAAAVPALLAWLLAWLLFWGVLTFLVFFWDKLCARRGWRRISEARLLWLALLGGILGAKYAQRRLRHKTYKQPFGRRLNQIAAFWGLALGLWALNFLFPDLAGAAMPGQ